MFDSQAEIEAALIDAEVPVADASKFARAALPGVWLRTSTVTDESTIPLGATKLGGLPDLAADATWPIRPAYPNHEKRTQHMRKALESKNPWPWAKPEQREKIRQDTVAQIALIERAAPLTFLAQINFGGLPVALDADMPRSGVLSIFYDVAEQPWGYDPQERMAFAFRFSDRAALQRRQPPENTLTLPPLVCEQVGCWTPVSADNPVCDAIGVADESRDALHAWWNDDDNMYATDGGTTWKCHRIGGWPNAIQGAMQTQCALVAAGHYCGDTTAYRDPALESVRATWNEWLLLAQIGSDEKGDLSWGDSGQLYVWIRREDLKARRFEQALLILQCY